MSKKSCSLNSSGMAFLFLRCLRWHKERMNIQITTQARSEEGQRYLDPEPKVRGRNAMNNEFSASKSANEREMEFARINSDAEIENCFFEEWMTEVRGKGVILKETIGDWIVTLSFMGIGIGDDFLKTGRPGFWEVSEWNRRRRYGMAYDYGSEEDATESFFDSVDRYRSEAGLG